MYRRTQVYALLCIDERKCTHGGVQTNAVYSLLLVDKRKVYALFRVVCTQQCVSCVRSVRNSAQPCIYERTVYAQLFILTCEQLMHSRQVNPP